MVAPADEDSTRENAATSVGAQEGMPAAGVEGNPPAEESHESVWASMPVVTVKDCSDAPGSRQAPARVDDSSDSEDSDFGDYIDLGACLGVVAQSSCGSSTPSSDGGCDFKQLAAAALVGPVGGNADEPVTLSDLFPDHEAFGGLPDDAPEERVLSELGAAVDALGSLADPEETAAAEAGNETQELPRLEDVQQQLDDIMARRGAIQALSVKYSTPASAKSIHGGAASCHRGQGATSNERVAHALTRADQVTDNAPPSEEVAPPAAAPAPAPAAAQAAGPGAGPAAAPAVAPAGRASGPPRPAFGPAARPEKHQIDDVLNKLSQGLGRLAAAEGASAAGGAVKGSLGSLAAAGGGAPGSGCVGREGILGRLAAAGAAPAAGATGKQLTSGGGAPATGGRGKDVSPAPGGVRGDGGGDGRDDSSNATGGRSSPVLATNSSECTRTVGTDIGDFGSGGFAIGGHGGRTRCGSAGPAATTAKESVAALGAVDATPTFAPPPRALPVGKPDTSRASDLGIAAGDMVPVAPTALQEDAGAQAWRVDAAKLAAARCCDEAKREELWRSFLAGDDMPVGGDSLPMPEVYMAAGR